MQIQEEQLHKVKAFFHKGENIPDDLLVKDWEITYKALYQGEIVLTNLTGASLCPHHMLPIYYKANLIYKPRKDKIIGSSKPYKVFSLVCATPLMQEEVTQKFTDLFIKTVKPESFAFVVKGSLTCFSKDGVDFHNSNVITNASYGKDKEWFLERLSKYEL